MVAGLCAAPGAGALTSPGFAPYVDLTGSPTPNLVALRRAAGVRQLSLGFITASGGTRCAARWGGYPALGVSGSRAYRRTNVITFEHAGGRAIVSFGGAAGTELASACATPSQTEAAYAAALATYRPSRLDFDIEGAAIADRAATARRNAAIAMLQHAHQHIAVSFTLPVLPSGLTADGLALVRSAIHHHVRLTLINLMTMDYGDSAAARPAGRMGAYAIAAAAATHRQLARLYPHLTQAARWRLIGLTPMIGRNDVNTETFGLSDARQLAAFAHSHAIGALSMWSLARDRACHRPTDSAQESCSGVAQRPYAFTRALSG